MREAIRRGLSINFNGQADALLLRDIQDGLIAANTFDMPEGFLKRWLRTQNEKNTEESIEAGFDAFTQNLRWTLIRSKIAKSSNVEISDEDLINYYVARIRGYLGGMAGNDELIQSLVERVTKDEKQMSELYEEVLTEKTFEAMKSRVNIVDKPIGEEEFNSIMAAAQYEAAKARGELKEGDGATDSAEEVEVEEVEAEEV
jgi:trigger factor